MSELASKPGILDVLETLRATEGWRNREPLEMLLNQKHLSTEFPSAWTSELITQFYGYPELAADVWDALRKRCLAADRPEECRLKLLEDILDAEDAAAGSWRDAVPSWISPSPSGSRRAAAKAERGGGTASSTSDDDATTVAGDPQGGSEEAAATSAEHGPSAEAAGSKSAESEVRATTAAGKRKKQPTQQASKSRWSMATFQWPPAGTWFGRPADTPERRHSRICKLLRSPGLVREKAKKTGIAVPFSFVLEGELDQISTCRRDLRGSTSKGSQGPNPCADRGEWVAATRRAFMSNLLGLAFSGGGIRSATFNLGVLQALASNGILQQCDYLSTVSGGGYIGSWFAAWLARLTQAHAARTPGSASAPAAAFEDIRHRLSPPRNPNPLESRVRPIRYLREYSNYLTPRTGFLSADTWTMLGIFTRNLLLNQLILVTLCAALLLVPRVVAAAVFSTGRYWAATMAAASYGFGAFLLIKNLRRLEPIPEHLQDATSPGAQTPVEREPPAYSQPIWIQAGVVVVWVIAAAFAGHAVAGWTDPEWRDLRPLIAGVLIALHVLVVLVAGKASRCWHDDRSGAFWAIVWATIGTGTAASGLAWVVLWAFQYLPWSGGFGPPWHVVALGTPALMAVMSLSIVVQLGMLGEKFPDEHREWWSRLRTYMHMYSLGWLAWFATAMYVPWGFHALREVHYSGYTGVAAVLAWLLSTVLGVRAGHTVEADKPGKAADAAPSGPAPIPMTTRIKRAIAVVAPYVFIVGLVAGVSLAIDGIYHYNSPDALHPPLEYWHYATWTISEWTFGAWPHSRLPGLVWALVPPVACGLICWLLSTRVNINEFSMHHFYKNRLVRCYLGASRADERMADWFTGFDPLDDIRLTDFDHNQQKQPPERRYPGPYPIVNCALNLVAGKDLAWQERKAQPFVFTPKYCGYDYDRAVLRKSSNAGTEAFVPTSRYYHDGVGPRLGMAMAISGAAANPNMGRATSPASAFLLTVFNARLGWWLGNPRVSDSVGLPGPTYGLPYTMFELTGSTDDDKPFINVSDGGHFDNLGIYELVRRGCRYIIACDAGQDGNLVCEDLGDVIRRCRSDLGVDIDISVDRIRERTATGGTQAHCVVGKIHYLNVPRRDARGRLVNDEGRPLNPADPRDRPGHEVGYLMYLKPTITGDEPFDVLEYYARVPEFPHESTADQWFDESQFESYRTLGMHIGTQAFARYASCDSQGDLTSLFERLYKYWYRPSVAINRHSTRHAEAYVEIMERVRLAPALQKLDPTLFDGLPDNPAVPLSPRDEFYIANALIQLMENVYADLDLDENWNHPHVEGWMSLFRRWAHQGAFRRTWAVSQSTYAERFRNFYSDRLADVKRGRRPLPFRNNFVAAHRGCFGDQIPENTLAAFERAIIDGADAIELDVRRLKDGTHVVFHDAAADADGRQPLSSLSLDELKDVSRRDVPTLAMCLDHLRGRIKLDIELKEIGTEEAVLDQIRRAAWSVDDVVLTSINRETLTRIRAARADIALGLIVDSPSIAGYASGPASELPDDVDFLLPEAGTKLTEHIDRLAMLERPLVPWTTPGNDDEKQLLGLFCHAAVAGVVTDNVITAKQVAAQVLL